MTEKNSLLHLPQTLRKVVTEIQHACVPKAKKERYLYASVRLLHYMLCTPLSRSLPRFHPLLRSYTLIASFASCRENLRLGINRTAKSKNVRVCLRARVCVCVCGARARSRSESERVRVSESVCGACARG
jgi:hypothetical protein